MDALARANGYRFARASMKREVKARELLVSDVLREHPVPDWLASMLIEELLRVTPRFQSKLARSLVHGIPAKDTATVGDLTYRKRRVLSELVAEWEAKHQRRASGRKAASHTFGAAKTSRTAVA